jgi:hypothetical protein
MTRRTQFVAGWIGLLAIALHAVVPVAMAAYGTPSAPHAHARHAQAAHHDGHAAEVAPHNTHNTHHGVHQAPAAPDTFCAGDCPCCTTNFKAILPSRALLVWMVSMAQADAPEALPASFRSAQAPHDHPARAPPARS